MADNNRCPCCGRHCDLSEPHCDRGREYARTGIIPERAAGGHKNSCRAADYGKMDTDNKLVMNLRDLGHTIRFLFEGKGSQKRILIILRESGSITQRELTERMGIQPGSASEVIGKLENAGFIQRTPSSEDRRTAEITLTEEGREKADEALQQRKTRHREMFSCLSEEEKNTLLTLTEKLSADWERRYRDLDKGSGHEHSGMNDRHDHHDHHGGFHHH